MVTTAKRTLAAAAAAFLAACGGGASVGGLGVGLGFGTGFVDDVDPRAQLVVHALQVFDALAGVERLLDFTNGQPAIEGAAGTDRSTACPGGGLVRLRKPDAGNFELAALDCRLRSDDPLIYSGSWKFILAANSYPSAGCAAGATCRLDAVIDDSAVTFRYGNGPAMPVVGRRYESVTAAGVRTARVSALNEPWPFDSGLQGVVSGSIADVTATIGQVTYRVQGNAARQALLVLSPLRATVTLGTEITAAVDNDANGIAERTLAIPWNWLLP